MSNAHSAVPEGAESMPWFKVQLTISVRADSTSDAFDIAHGAFEHLYDTFNDDGSIHKHARIEVLPGSTTLEEKP